MMACSIAGVAGVAGAVWRTADGYKVMPLHVDIGPAGASSWPRATHARQCRNEKWPNLGMMSDITIPKLWTIGLASSRRTAAAAVADLPCAAVVDVLAARRCQSDAKEGVRLVYSW